MANFDGNNIQHFLTTFSTSILLVFLMIFFFLKKQYTTNLQKKNQNEQFGRIR